MSPGPKAPNLLSTLTDLIPKSRSQISSLRLDPDDFPALSAVEKSVLSKVYWSKVWAKPSLVIERERVEFLRGYDKKFDHFLCKEPGLDLVKAITPMASPLQLGGPPLT